MSTEPRTMCNAWCDSWACTHPAGHEGGHGFDPNELRAVHAALDAAVIAAATDPLRTLQAECVEWHTAKFPGKTPLDVMAKLTEEVGEIARALVGETENREGRGDVCDEAAQAVLVLVLATLVGRFYQRDLLADALTELRRHQAQVDVVVSVEPA